MKTVNDPCFTPSPQGLQAVGIAKACWGAHAAFRRDRRRNKLYTFGDQWKDPILVDGVTMTEEEYILREGNLPLKNNLIRRLVRSVTGLFRNRMAERDDLTQAEAELYARTMEEFLISGIAVHRRMTGHDGGAVMAPVSPDSFFYDPTARDPRGLDAETIGQVHDLTLPQFCATFANSPGSYRRWQALCSGQSRIRVYEVWTREHRPRWFCHDKARGVIVAADEEVYSRNGALRIMPSHWGLHDVWRYRYVTAQGEVLKEGDSPLEHGRHPFVFKAYPFLDGEIHSFVSDIIDQQRYTNRLITLYDWVMRASAKGVLLFPEEALPPGGGVDMVADQWSRFNGVIVYRPKMGIPEPKQVNNSSANSGIADLLNIQLKMMEDIAGVNGALQGRVENMATSGALYRHQTENALTSLRDILDTFESFIDDCKAAVDSQNPIMVSAGL